MAQQTVLAALQQAQQNIANNIQEMTLKPKPSYNIDGVSYSWSELYNTYMQQMKELEQSIQRAGGPFQLESTLTAG